MVLHTLNNNHDMKYCKRILMFLVLLQLQFAHATTYPVTNTNNAGAGSLRQAILNANADVTPGPHYIPIQVAGNLTLAALLPTISNSMIIDGTVAPGYVAGSPTFSIFHGWNNYIFEASNVTGISIKGIFLDCRNRQPMQFFDVANDTFVKW